MKVTNEFLSLHLAYCYISSLVHASCLLIMHTCLGYLSLSRDLFLTKFVNFFKIKIFLKAVKYERDVISVNCQVPYNFNFPDFLEKERENNRIKKINDYCDVFRKNEKHE